MEYYDVLSDLHAIFDNMVEIISIYIGDTATFEFNNLTFWDSFSIIIIWLSFTIKGAMLRST